MLLMPFSLKIEMENEKLGFLSLVQLLEFFVVDSVVCEYSGNANVPSSESNCTVGKSSGSDFFFVF